MPVEGSLNREVIIHPKDQHSTSSEKLNSTIGKRHNNIRQKGRRAHRTKLASSDTQ